MAKEHPVSIKVEGINKLVRQLKKADDESTLKDLKQVNVEGADKVAKTARPLTPVLTGKLRASVRSSGTERMGVVRSGKKAVPYAGVIHFGWPERGISPTPFLYEALDSRRDEVLAAYEKTIQQIVDRIAD